MVASERGISQDAGVDLVHRPRSSCTVDRYHTLDGLLGIAWRTRPGFATVVRVRTKGSSPGVALLPGNGMRRRATEGLCAKIDITHNRPPCKGHDPRGINYPMRRSDFTHEDNPVTDDTDPQPNVKPPHGKPGPKPLPPGVKKDVALQFLVRGEYAVWVRRFAAWTKFSQSRLYEEALNHYAKDRRFPEPPPHR
jgi:hypothetical protein